MKFMKGMAMFMAGVFTTIGVTVMADQAVKTITATYRDIKIYADGKQVDTSGGKEPFLYNGTTYLPVRAVGEAIGKTVEWDAANNAVYLGQKPSSLTSSGEAEPTVLLENMDYFVSSLNIGSIVNLINTGRDNTGKAHETGILLSGKGSTEYLLNGQYKHFKGTVAIDFESRNEPDVSVLKIYGDDKLLYTSPEMKGGVLPETFDVNLTGVNSLKLVFEDYGNLMIYDAGFFS